MDKVSLKGAEQITVEHAEGGPDLFKIRFMHFVGCEQRPAHRIY